MTKFLLLLVVLATACAAPQSRDNQQHGNKPCVNSATKIHISQDSETVSETAFIPTNIHSSQDSDTVSETAFIPTNQDPTNQDPTNHYYFSAPLDAVKKEPQKYIEVPDEVRYNIIFVKVPPFVPKVQEKIDLQPKTDEKTTVYVLVKRPEDPEIIELPEPKKLEDEKPEVIVVKYNKDKDIQAAIDGVDQSRLFGDLGIVRTAQVSEAQVNEDLGHVKKEDITQLELVGDTRILTNQRSSGELSQTSGSSVDEDTNQSNINTSSTKGSSVENEEELPKYIKDKFEANELTVKNINKEKNKQ